MALWPFTLLPFSLHAQSIDTLDTVVVTADAETSEQDSLIAALERAAASPGAAFVTTHDDWTGRAVGPEEIFQFNPAVYARSRGVGNDTRISIRGSGLQRQFGDRGLTLLLDGIPANDADGSFYYRAVDPFSIHHIEVFPGANGLPYGATQLGGAVNIVQKNGLNTEGVRLQLEAGRFETYRSHFSYGGSNDRWDWYAAYSYAESEGYRERQDWRTHTYNASLGYHWSDSATTRLYFHASDSDAALTSSLTEEQFREDPQQDGNPNRPDGVDRDLSTIRLGQRTEWETTNGRWSFHTNYQYLDFDHLINQGNRVFNRFIDYDSDDFQIGLQGEERGQLFGLENAVRLSTRYNYGRQKEDGFGGFVILPFRPVAQIDRENTAENLQIYLEDELSLTEQHHFIVGAGYVATRRNVDLNSGDTTGDEAGELTDDGLTYRLGYRFDISDRWQLFSNYSQSFEGSTFGESEERLEPQIARTFEIGSRFANDWLDAQIAVYHSDVEDEFIDEEIADGVSQTMNLDTERLGLEVALSLNLTEAMGWDTAPLLHFDQVYQLNDFTIAEGLNSGNDLPGISKQVYSGRLRLENRDKNWRVGLAAEWLPEGLNVDNANSIATKGFINWRLSGELALTDNIRIYGGVDNLFDKDYVNSVTVNPSGSAFINPSTARSAYIGLKFAW